MGCKNALEERKSREETSTRFWLVHRNQLGVPMSVFQCAKALLLCLPRPSHPEGTCSGAAEPIWLLPCYESQSPSSFFLLSFFLLFVPRTCKESTTMQNTHIKHIHIKHIHIIKHRHTQTVIQNRDSGNRGFLVRLFCNRIGNQVHEKLKIQLHINRQRDRHRLQEEEAISKQQRYNNKKKVMTCGKRYVHGKWW